MEAKHRLPEQIDRSKVYYKITNRKEVHNGLKYRDGLVEDIVPFNDNPDESCVEGGIYFTTLEYLPAFFGYGIWIRPIIIPEDAKVVLDSEGDKYRADKVYMLPKIPLEKYMTDLFDKDNFHLNLYYGNMFRYFSEDFDKWWDPDKFNWKDDSWMLANFYSKYFNKWWDKNRFDWETGSGDLAEFCSDYFDIWWDPEKYNWKRFSEELVRYCSKHFDKWWDPEKFNWKTDSWSLAIHCSKHFTKWWDPDKFNWEHCSWILAEHYSKHFDIWWNPNKFNWKEKEYLIKYCSDHFEKYYDKSKFRSLKLKKLYTRTKK